MREKRYLRITFLSPINGYDWTMIKNIFYNDTQKYLSFFPIEMSDVLYKVFKITVRLIREEESLLKGLIGGYLRVMPIFEHMNEWGDIVP